MTTVVGTGYTGARLLQSDASIRGISRSVPDGVDPSRITVIDLDDEIPVVSSDDALVYTVPPDDDTDRRLANLLANLDRPPRRIVYLSTTGVYGHRDGDRVLETDPVNPQTDRAQRRVNAEQQLATFSKANDMELVVLRVPGIYGPGRLGLARIQHGEPVLRNDEVGPGNRIHVDDLAAICLRATEPGVPAGIYNVGDGDHRSSTWFTQEAARLAELPAPPVVDRKKANEVFSPMRLSFLNESRTIDTTKLRDVMGFTPHYTDATDGIRASLKES